MLPAATGLLDGGRATTHWAAAKELSRRYPDADVDADVLFVDNGQVLTSAGAAAGLGLCLHTIRKDHGSAVSANAARIATMSTRSLNRRFREQTGTTPLRWLHRARIRWAQHLLETTGHSGERIGMQVGFGSPTTFRDRSKRVVGTSPRNYRRAFQGEEGHSQGRRGGPLRTTRPSSAQERTLAARARGA